MYSYETDLGRFVGREKKARRILRVGRDIIRDRDITVLYGSKDYEKTAFFVAFVDSQTLSRSQDTGFSYSYGLRFSRWVDVDDGVGR